MDLAAAQNRVLSLRNQQLSDSEFAIFLNSFKSDAYFAVLDLSHNLLSDASAQLLSNFIRQGCSAAEEIHLEDNRIGETGGEELERARNEAFERQHRSWNLFLTGNQMSQALIARLEDPLVLPFTQIEQVMPSDTLPRLSLSSSSSLSLEPIPAYEGTGDTFSSGFFSPRLLPRLLTTSLSSSSEDYALSRPSANYRAKGWDSLPYRLQGALHLKRLAAGNNQIRRIENLPAGLEGLELSGNLLEKIEGLERLERLKYLDLSRNKIGEIEGLEGNKELVVIRLGQNRIRTAAGLEHLQRLKRLDLSANLLSAFADIRPLSLNSRLKVLLLASNPLCLLPLYEQTVQGMLPALLKLDDVALQGENTGRSHHSFFSLDFSLSEEEKSSNLTLPMLQMPPQPPSARLIPMPQPDVEPEEPFIPSPASRSISFSSSQPRPRSNSSQSASQSPHLTDKEQENIVNRLLTFPLYRGFPGSQLHSLLVGVERQRAERGDVIQDGKENAKGVVVILKGGVRWKERKHGPWTLLFPESLYSAVPAEDAVVCAERSEFALIDPMSMHDLLSSNPSLEAILAANQTSLLRTRLNPLPPPNSTLSVPPLPLKTALRPSPSQTLVLSAQQTDSRSRKIQAEIEKLFSGDPFKPESGDFPVLPPIDSFATWKEAVQSINSHISSLAAYYQIGTTSDNESLRVEREAKGFAAQGPAKSYEFIAIHRPFLREAVDIAYRLPRIESVSDIRPEGWLDASLMGREPDSSLKPALERWIATTRHDIEAAAGAISKVLLGNTEEVLQERLIAWEESSGNPVELVENPEDFLMKMCGEQRTHPEIAHLAGVLTQLARKCAYLKQILSQLLTATNTKDTETVERLREAMVKEGIVTFSLAPDSRCVDTTGRGDSVAARAWIHKTTAVRPDSSVPSGVSSRR